VDTNTLTDENKLILQAIKASDICVLK